MTGSLADRLEAEFPGAVLQGVSLAAISRWRIGGTADLVVRPRSVEELCRLRAWIAAQGLDHVVIGATSNLLFADEGLRAIAVQIGPDFGGVRLAGNRIIAGAGVWVPGLARAAMQAGLTGIEHTCGIPGTLGGLVCMNGGSQRHGIGEALIEVTSVDAAGTLRRRSVEDCGFAYRRSIFQENGEIVVEAVLELIPVAGADLSADRATARSGIRRRMLQIMGDRRRKFPHRTPNCGSVFVSNPAMYAEYGPPGAVIEKLGFKGRRIGGAEVSPLHANFIVNTGAARAADVLALIAGIKSAVHRETGYDMEVEARFVRPSGAMLPADARALA